MNETETNQRANKEDEIERSRLQSFPFPNHSRLDTHKIQTIENSNNEDVMFKHDAEYRAFFQEGSKSNERRYFRIEISKQC